MNLEENIRNYLDREGVIEVPTKAIYQKVADLWGTGADQEIEKVLTSWQNNQIYTLEFYDFVARSLGGTPLYDVLAGRARKGVTWDIKNVALEVETNHINILDVGCGSGLMICFLAQMYPTKQFTALDLSEKMLITAKNRSEKNVLSNISFVNKSLEDYYFYSPKYDIVLCAHSLYEKRSALGTDATCRFAMLADIIASHGKLIIIENEVPPLQGGYAEEREHMNLSENLLEKRISYNDADHFGMCHLLQVFLE